MKPYTKQTKTRPPKLSTQEHAGRYQQGAMSDDNPPPDKTKHCSSRPGAKEKIRNSNRSVKKGARQEAKKTTAAEVYKVGFEIVPKAAEEVPVKVVAISDNTNAFGLHGVILMAADGRAWEIGVGDHAHGKPKTGDILLLTLDDDGMPAQTLPFMFEIPRKLPKAQPGVVRGVWGVS